MASPEEEGSGHGRAAHSDEVGVLGLGVRHRATGGAAPEGSECDGGADGGANKFLQSDEEITIRPANMGSGRDGIMGVDDFGGNARKSQEGKRWIGTWGFFS